MADNYPLVCITGPTACGKTHLAVQVARLINGEIISADSRQVYRHMDIGTGKDIAEYAVGGVRVPYHLIDIAEAGYRYNVYEYQRDFYKAYADISSRGKVAICCGGSGMYVESVLKGYRLDEVPVNEAWRAACKHKSDEELIEELTQYRALHNVSDTSSRDRLERALEIAIYYATHEEENKSVKYDYRLFCIDIDRAVLRHNIALRLEERLKAGMVSEVEVLLKSGISAADLKYYGLEYKYITMYLNGELGYEDMKNELGIAIGQFAKRQQTWFRRMQKQGFNMVMIPYGLPLQDKINMVLTCLR